MEAVKVVDRRLQALVELLPCLGGPVWQPSYKLLQDDRD
jgi:hypothetical protein